MNDEPTPAEPEAERPQSGVFAKLPDSRPGTRSPRRAGPGGAGRQEAVAAAAKRKTSGSAASAPGRRAPRSAPRGAEARRSAAASRSARPAAARESEPRSGGGLEDVAWAGIAVAAEAATIGVRLASRAIETLRGSSGRN